MRAISPNRITQGQHGASKAVDYGASPDINIYAPEDGTVVSYGQQGAVGTVNDAGIALRLQGASGLHQFAHTEASYVSVGQRVSKGQPIAKMGYTGYTIPKGPAGRHCHWWIQTSNGFVYPPNLINEPFGSQGGSEVIPDQDNWFWRMDRLMWQIRGRGLSREEFRKNFVGVPVFRMVEILSDDAEANRALEAQNIGQLALKDNWQGQIYSLQDQVKALSSRPTKEQIDVLNKQVTDLTASYNTAQNNAEVAQKALEEAKNKQTEDTKLLDEGKGVFSWITKLIERLKK